MATKATKFSDQNSKTRQKYRSVGFTSTQPIKAKKQTEFDVWELIKRSRVDHPYCLALRYRSSTYQTAPGRRSRNTTPATIHRRRKQADSAKTSDSDGRSSQLSTLVDMFDGENFFKEDYDYDAEEPEEPPIYPHLVDKPGTYIQQLYLKACRHFHVPHSSFFYRHLTDDMIVLRRQRLGPHGVKACAVALVSLEWYEQPISRSYDEAQAGIVGRIPQETLVHSVDLTDNNIGPEGARYLAELISENSIIKHMDISHNALGYDGVSAIADVLKKTDSLISLDISDNGLDDRNIEAVRPIIEETHNLKSLSLSHNELREEGGRIVGDALSWNDTITDIDLSWNHLRRKGAIKVAEALAKNIGLIYLNLSWNGLHMSGCTAISKALERNSTLTELDLSSNRIDRACLSKLNNGLKKNSTLVTLKIGQNPLNADDALAMLTFLQENPSSGLKCIDIKDISIDVYFLDVLEELRATREVTILHGKLIGHGMEIHDIDEGQLVKEDPWVVMEQLGRVIGVNIQRIFTDISEELHVSLTPEQIVTGLKILQNPLSDRCAEILVKRLDRDIEGLVDFRHIANKSKTIQEHGSSGNDTERHDGFDGDEECYSEETISGKIHKCIYRVMTRRMCGSTLYRRNVKAISQDGEQHLKNRIIHMLIQCKEDVELAHTLDNPSVNSM